ncbi:hypothetical protein HII36_09720 [Nonomuraea sp. NN258]|nr:hypothetical protein [Nonomuraea antri]NRQ32114.1 hypothetical protein [Nonomuraea antri]
MSEETLADSKLAQLVAKLAGQTKTRPDSTPTIPATAPQPTTIAASAG